MMRDNDGDANTVMREAPTAEMIISNTVIHLDDSDLAWMRVCEVAICITRFTGLDTGNVTCTGICAETGSGFGIARLNFPTVEPRRSLLLIASHCFARSSMATYRLSGPFFASIL